MMEDRHTERSSGSALLAGAESLEFRYVYSIFRRNIRLISAAILIGVAFSAVYILTVRPEYSSTSTIILDRTSAGAAGQNPELLIDSGAVESQLEVIKSDKVAEDLIEKLDLKNEPEFNVNVRTTFSFIFDYISSLLNLSGSSLRSEEEMQDIWKRNARARLAAGLTVTRLARTQVLTVQYSAPTPELAAKIANGFAQAYLKDQLEARFSAAEISSIWLMERIGDIRAKSIAADLAVQRFRAKYNLVASDGKLLDEQQMSQLNLAFITAVGETKRLKARYERLQAMIDAGDMDAAAKESLANPLVNTLRERYLRTLKTLNTLVSILPEGHAQLKALRAEMTEYTSQTFEELRRISDSYKSETEIALAAEQALLDSFKGSVDLATANNEVMVQLRALQSESETLKKLYEGFLQKYQEVIQYQSRPVTEARIIGQAYPNYAPTKPKRPLVIIFGIAFGLVGGMGAAILLEIVDTGFRRRTQVREVTGLECIGMLPNLNKDDVGSIKAWYSRTFGYRSLQATRSSDPELLTYALRSPSSRYTETLRAVKISVDEKTTGKSTKIVGFISTFPGEGKTTTAKNMASMLAFQGNKVLLIDGDLKNNGLTRAIAGERPAGLVDVLESRLVLADCLIKEAASGLTILPSKAAGREKSTGQMMSSPKMTEMLAELSKDFEYIILDLPPLASVVDVRAAEPLFDCFVYLVEWGTTNRGIVSATLEENKRVAEKCVGIVLNKVDQNRIAWYEYYSGNYYRRYYSYEYGARPS